MVNVNKKPYKPNPNFGLINTPAVEEAFDTLNKAIDENGLPICSQDPELWWSDDPAEILMAKHYCTGCPILRECGMFALVNREKNGVWGGLSKNERATILRRPHHQRGDPGVQKLIEDRYKNGI